ncbi:NAD-dependent epimerase/dehydratase family protein [Roseivivax sediminis]|uniref:dTDP-L-rhamnose 4-epimerase n=1 Tax=Roseivivax sediminis TaxID=936889 RepID=A0A1I2CVC6_9RHOB|nr:NAD-dependent epimerase/dehydratase family protein [Roseivivax sediminis]SFE72256.1 dTDP-L-rhamnose 4-epimerase [Roseivivax sediminis]
MQKTLIIGGAGFIGTRLFTDFGPENFTVSDNLSPIVHNKKSIADFVGSGVEFFPGDVTQPDDVKALFEEGVPTNLVLLAAETGTGRSLHNVTLNTRVNAMGTALVLDALSAIGTLPKRVVLTSSRAVYGEGPYLDESGKLVYPQQRAEADLKAGKFEFDGLTPQAMCAADHLPNPSNIYGATKLCQENLLRNWAQSFGVDAYILRLQNVYGAGQSLTNPYTGVLIHFLRMLSQKKTVNIYENGGITRDFVHVADIASAIAAALSGKGPAGTYDIGSGERLTLEAVASQICELTGGPAPEFCDAYRLGDVRHAAADITAAQTALGWEPKVSLKDGLSGLIDFFEA